MNRRDFLRSLGVGLGALAIDPSSLIAGPVPPETYVGYPTPYFTGFKCAHDMDRYAGQLLWGVLWEDEQHRQDFTQWYCACVLDGNDLKGKLNPLPFVRAQMQNLLMSAMALIDQSMVDAAAGQVEVVSHEPNPGYDPNHAHEHDDEDDDGWGCSLCSPTRQCTKKIQVLRAKPVSYLDMGKHWQNKEALWAIEYPPLTNSLDIERLALESLRLRG
jgi:hypothetical protein